MNTRNRWLKFNKLITAESCHLRRIHKQDGKSTLLLNIGLFALTVPEELNLPPPYAVTVPIASAETEVSLALKNTLWPTLFTPRRKGEMEPWSRAKVQWAYSAAQHIIVEAKKAQDGGEVRFLVQAHQSYLDLCVSYLSWRMSHHRSNKTKRQIPSVQWQPTPGHPKTTRCATPSSTWYAKSLTSHPTRKCYPENGRTGAITSSPHALSSSHTSHV